MKQWRKNVLLYTHKMNVQKKSLSIVLRATDRCNQDCKYCYVDQTRRKRSSTKLPLNDLERFLESVLDGSHYRHVSIVWHGGEPTLAGVSYLRKAFELQRTLARSGVVVENLIQTNATVLGSQMVEFLREADFKVGVSVDAPKRIHDEMRVFWGGRGTMDSVQRGIDLLRNNNISCGAICVLHRANCHLASEIYDFFKEIDLNYKFNPFYKDENTLESVADNLSISPELYAQALIETFDRWIEDPNPTVVISDLRDIVESMFRGFSTNCLFAGACSDFLGGFT